MQSSRLVPALLCTAGLFALLPTAAPAQLLEVIPKIGAGTASTHTSYPWNRRSSSCRVQYSYDAPEIPVQGVVVITEIRFRPSDTIPATTMWSGGTYGDVEVRLSTGVNPSASLSTTFAANHGNDLTSVYRGPVDLMGGAGNGSGVPALTYIRIKFTKPFIYNTTGGPLLLDLAIDGSKWVANGGTTPTYGTACTYTTENKPVSRMYNLSSHTATTGSFQDKVGLVLEIGYSGARSTGVTNVGDSCTDGFDHPSIWTTRETAAVGNANFHMFGNGLPPGAQGMVFVGIVPNLPSISLALMGAPTCELHTDIMLQVPITTSAGTASYSDGNYTLSAPIPNNPSVSGAFIRTQLAVADANSKRPFGVVFTNGLTVKVQ